MLFITSIISILSFRGSQVILNTHLRIQRLRDNFMGLMVVLQPLPRLGGYELWVMTVQFVENLKERIYYLRILIIPLMVENL